jgi:dTDP-glucose 4,6-dehydratase
MKILVTGGLGFIGSNLVRHLLTKYPDAKVTNIDKISVGANPLNLKDLKHDRRYRFVRGDISHPRHVAKLIKSHETVINCAAETHVDRSIANPSPFMRSNVLGTFTLLEAMRKNNPKVRLVHVSTDEIYGDVSEGSFTESSILKPSNPYSASKAAADMLTLTYKRTYGSDVMVTRCTNNFGPYQHPEKLIPKTIIRAKRNLPIPLYGEGKQVRDWIYVRDHCEALVRVMESGKSGSIYNISAGNEIPNLRVVEQILELMNKPKEIIQFVEDRPGHDVRYSLDSSRIRSELGWGPSISFREALDKTIEWYLNNENVWKPLASKKSLNPTPWKLKW